MATKKTKKKRKPKSKSYVRGTLIHKMYEFFDKVGLDAATYDKCKKLAKSIKSDTKFNRYHHSWYRNDYRNKRNLPSPTMKGGK